VKRRRLRKRYGRAWSNESAITRPAGGGLYDVVLVNARGSEVGVLGRRMPYTKAREIIRKRHG
jgi:hypothetical protein